MLLFLCCCFCVCKFWETKLPIVVNSTSSSFIWRNNNRLLRLTYQQSPHLLIHILPPRKWLTAYRKEIEEQYIFSRSNQGCEEGNCCQKPWFYGFGCKVWWNNARSGATSSESRNCVTPTKTYSLSAVSLLWWDSPDGLWPMNLLFGRSRRKIEVGWWVFKTKCFVIAVVYCDEMFSYSTKYVITATFQSWLML